MKIWLFLICIIWFIQVQDILDDHADVKSEHDDTLCKIDDINTKVGRILIVIMSNIGG